MWNELHVCLPMNVARNQPKSDSSFAFFSFFLYSFPRLLVFPCLLLFFFLLEQQSRPSAGTDWQLLCRERNQWHTTLHPLLGLQKDLEGRWNVWQERFTENFKETSRQPKTGAVESSSKNKALVCSALRVPLCSLATIYHSSFFITKDHRK